MSKKKKENRIGVGRLLIWKSSDVSQAAVQAIVLGYLSLYCTDTLGIAPAMVGVLLAASKVVDAFTDLFAGWLVDNTNTRLGKGRPYELCIIGVTLCSMGLFMANPDWSMFFKCAWIFCMYTLVFSVFTTFRQAGNTAYTIRAFSNNQVLITKVSSYGGIITMAGSILVSMLFPRVMGRLATSASGWTATVAIFVIPLTLIALLRFIFIKEDPSVDAGQQHQKVSFKEIFSMLKINKYVWLYAGIMLFYNISTSLGATTYYFQWVIGDIRQMSFVAMLSIIVLPLMFVFPVIMRKIGSMGNMIAYFAAIGVVGYIIAFFSGTNLAGIMIGMLLGSFAGLPIAYYGVLFIMRCCTYNEMKGMPRMDASSNIMANFMSKVGAAGGSLITGVLLSLAGYVSGNNVTAQPDSAILMIRILFAIAPAICMAVIGICSKQFATLEKMIPEWEEKKKAESAGKEGLTTVE